MSSVAMIELRDVSKIYHLGDERYRALDRVRLTIAPGDFVGVMGPGMATEPAG